MRAKKIITQRSINECDLTLPSEWDQFKPSRGPAPITVGRVFRWFAVAIAVAIYWHITH